MNTEITEWRFITAKIPSQLNLDLISGGFLFCGFIKRDLLYC